MIGKLGNQDRSQQAFVRRATIDDAIGQWRGQNTLVGVLA